MIDTIIGARDPARTPLRVARIASCVVAVVLVAYVGARERSIAITIDEALTFLWHVPGSLRDILLLRTPGLEDNNHVLLTLLGKASVGVLGASEAALRLPSLFAYVLFLWATYRILGWITSGWQHPLGMAAIGSNPYLIDYFTVARGYGLALGLSSAGLAYLLDGTRDWPILRQRPIYVAFLLFSLAAIAHLTFALMVAAAIVVLWAPYVLGGRGGDLVRMLRPRTRIVWLALAAIVVIQCYMVHLALVIRRVGLLGSGEARAFWSGTVGSLVDGTLYRKRSAFDEVVVFGWIVATLLAATWVVWARRSQSGDRRSPLAVILGLMVVAALASVVQHAMLGVALLDGRRAIALLPLFLMCALALPREASHLGGRVLRALAIALGVAAPALLAVQSFAVVNLERIRDWPHDAATREAMLAIARHPASDRRPLRLLTFWTLAPGAEFYRQTLGMTQLLEPLSWSDRPGYAGPADFYYVLDTQVPEVSAQGIEALASFPRAGTTLLARVRP